MAIFPKFGFYENELLDLCLARIKTSNSETVEVRASEFNGVAMFSQKVEKGIKSRYPQAVIDGTVRGITISNLLPAEKLDKGLDKLISLSDEEYNKFLNKIEAALNNPSDADSQSLKF